MLREKIVLFIINLFAFQIPIVFGQLAYNDILETRKSVNFSEHFENNSNQWITDNLWVSAKAGNSFYQISCKNYKNGTGLTCKIFPVILEKDFEIEASIKIIKGTGGLVFGMTTDFVHYRVELNDLDEVALFKNIPSKGKIEKLFSISSHTGIKPDTYNKITVRKLNDSYYIYLNEIYLGEFKNIILKGNQVGFNVGLNSEISVDYLTVTSIENLDSRDLASENKKILSPSGPEITWISPSGTTTSLGTYSAKIKASIKSELGLKGVLVYVNGVSEGEPELKPSGNEKGKFLLEKIISLNPGENNVYILASNDASAAKSELRYFTNPPATLPEIRWQYPEAQNAVINRDSFAIEVCIKSATELKSVKLFVNGATQNEDNVFPGSLKDECNYIWHKPVLLREGDNDIYIIAYNVAGSTTSEKRIVKMQKKLVEKRLALVMGNAEYGNKVGLKNPVHDANLMEATLKELGFEVIKRINAGRTEMEKAIEEFNTKLPSFNVGLFYYAGHGIQVDGVNYIIPTDAKLEDKTNCKWEAISLSDIVDEFEKYPENINIVILDACRNNPFRSWVRGNEAGFKFLPNVSGTIIGYATVEGATAADGTGDNGLYTEELVKQMLIPQAIERVFKQTRIQVEKRSKGTQSPREFSGLRGDFYFK